MREKIGNTGTELNPLFPTFVIRCCVFRTVFNTASDWNFSIFHSDLPNINLIKPSPRSPFLERNVRQYRSVMVIRQFRSYTDRDWWTSCWDCGTPNIYVRNADFISMKLSLTCYMRPILIKCGNCTHIAIYWYAVWFLCEGNKRNELESYEIGGFVWMEMNYSA